MNNDDPNDFIIMENEDEGTSSGIEEPIYNIDNDMDYDDDDDDDDDDDEDMDPDFQYFEEVRNQYEGTGPFSFRCTDFSATNEFGEGTSSGLEGNALYYIRAGDLPVAAEWGHVSQDQLSMEGWGGGNASGNDQPHSIVPEWGQETSNWPNSNMQEWNDYQFGTYVPDLFTYDIFEKMMGRQEGKCGSQTNDLDNGADAEMRKFANIQEMADYLESIILMLAIYLWCDQTNASNEEREKEALKKKNLGKKNGKDDDSGNPV